MSKKIKKNKKQVFIFVVGLIIVLIFLLFVNYLNKKNLSYKTKAAPNKIIGGQPATKGQFPYMARVKSSTGNCSGFLIYPYYVLTAAHCLADKPNIKNVSVAVNIINDNDFENNKIGILGYKINENYSKGMNNYDIAIIRLLKKPTNIDFKKIKLPFLPLDAQRKINGEKEPNLSDNYLYEKGNQATIIGFGCEKNRVFNGRLNYIDVPIFDSKDTFVFSFGYFNYSGQINTSYFTEIGCSGDSGGIVMINRNNKTYAIGVISSPISSVKTIKFTNWINNIIQNNIIQNSQIPCKYNGFEVSNIFSPQSKELYMFRDKNNCIIEVYNPTSVYKTTGYKCDPFTGESKPVTNKSDICAKK